MTTKYQINIQGYYQDSTRCQFPEVAGIYFVYRGTLNLATRKCTLSELIYIGETDNLHRRHNDHDRRQDFLNTLQEDERLFYSYALIEQNDDRKRIESSFIYELTPRLNEKDTQGFSYSETQIEIIGDRHAFVPNVIKAPSH